jgi:hypothetical protein
VIGDHRAAQRLLVLGVASLTSQVVRGLRDGLEHSRLRQMLHDRRGMLRALVSALPELRYARRLQALGAAVEESDRTVEVLIDQ